MIGLDTNVLLRLFVEDDPAQSDRARRFVGAAAADEPCLVNPVVLAEFAWTLARNFKIRRQEVARLIEGVLSMDDLEVPFRHAAERALDAYRGGKPTSPTISWPRSTPNSDAPPPRRSIARLSTILPSPPYRESARWPHPAIRSPRPPSPARTTPKCSAPRPATGSASPTPSSSSRSRRTSPLTARR